MRAVTAALALVALLATAACSERQPRLYEPGQYKGGKVAAPWDSAQFGGDRAAWERQLQVRNRGQNEYARLRND